MTILHIDRSKPFDPAVFLGKGWSVVEEDERSLALTEVDLSKVSLVTMLKEGEWWLAGQDKLKRLKDAGHIRLDAKIFHALWENQHLIPDVWKKSANGALQCVRFNGTELQGPVSGRYSLFLFWDDGWYYGWTDFGESAIGSFAVMAS